MYRIRFLTGLLAVVLLGTGCSSSKPDSPSVDKPETSTFSAASDAAPSGSAAQAIGSPDTGSEDTGSASSPSSDSALAAADDDNALDAADNTSGVSDTKIGGGNANAAVKRTIGKGAACAVGKPSVGGEITFVRGDRLIGIDTAAANPSERCLATLPGSLAGAGSRLTRWSPPATQALLGGGSVVTAEGTVKASGFLATNADVEWSYPTGKRLMAATAKGELVKRDVANGMRTDISYLAKHTDAAYHPAGKYVVSVGEDQDGNSGIFASSNSGGVFNALVNNETAERVWSPQFTGDGRNLLFLAKHDETVDAKTQAAYHVHNLAIAESDLSIALDATEPLDHLLVDPFRRQFAVQVGGCAPGNRVRVISLSGDRNVEIPGSESVTMTPIGWLPDAGLLIATSKSISSAANSCGPGSLVSLSVWSNGALAPLVDNVYSPSVRAIRPISKDVPLGIAPGET